MLSCMKYRKHLNTYLDNELRDRKRNAVERHLSVCPSCRAVLKALQDLEPVLQAANVPPPPADLTSRILETARRVRKNSTDKSIPQRAEQLLFPGWVLRGATAAALIIGLSIGGFMGWRSFGTDGYIRPGMMISKKTSPDSLAPAFDVLAAAPEGSIEGATMKLMAVKR